MSNETDTEIEPVNAAPATQETDVVIEAISKLPLMQLRPLPAELESEQSARPPTALLAALQSLGEAAPAMQVALRAASSQGQAVQIALQAPLLQVAFRPEVTEALLAGKLTLMQSATGALATAVDQSGKIVAQGRVVSSVASAAAGAGGAASSAAGGAATPLISGGGGALAGAAGGVAVVGGGVTLGAVAVVALPIVVAAGAAYMQQRKLEQTLGSIKEVVDRIEARLKDADTGVCDAADTFLELVADAMADGGLTDYLQVELAAQRVAVEALYKARRRWVERFKHDLEAEQISQEQSKGAGQPWVDSVAEPAVEGRLEEELILFVRSLIARSRLALLAATVLAEEGHARTAFELIDRTTTELRVEFFDLHRRLVPLAHIAPDKGLLGKIPGMGKDLERAHDSVKLLVDQLDKNVLPTIPLAEDRDKPIEITLPPSAVAVVAG